MRRLIDNGTTPPARLPHIGHYGHLRKSYLEGYRPDLYTALAASEKLYEHCAEIDAAARSRIDLIMPELAKSAGATEELKAADPMKWVGLMNACKAQAEEIVKNKQMRYLMATVHPDNIYSFRNMEKFGMKAVLETKKYGGKRRYVMSKTLES